jgi:hypothetical protein
LCQRADVLAFNLLSWVKSLWKCELWIEFISDVHVPVFLTNKRRMSLIFWKIWTSSAIMFQEYWKHVVKNAIRNLFQKRDISLWMGKLFLQTGVVKISLQKTFIVRKSLYVLDMSCKNIVWHTYVFFAYTTGSKSLHSRCDFTKYFSPLYFN